MDFVGNATPLDDNDIYLEAQEIGCEPAVIWAVCDVESAGSGFLPDKRPKILFEAHYFHNLTNGRYDRSNPNISSPSWDRSLYGRGGAHQYERLDEAIDLDREAALESASWGRFQIMGANYKACGYPNVEKFVSDMMDDEANHLKAFTAFCRTNGITGFLITKEWSRFTLRYNGSGQVAYYSAKLAEAYVRRLDKNDPPPGTTVPIPIPLPRKFLKYGDKGADVLELQDNLVKLGYRIVVDGDFGHQTETVVKDFQQKYNTGVDGVVGPMTQSLIALAVANL